MSDLVSPKLIERIVGVPRHPTEHWGRAVSAEERVYVLHSAECKTSLPDLRDCEYSIALDNGIDPADWIGDADKPVLLLIDSSDHLVPHPASRAR